MTAAPTAADFEREGLLDGLGDSERIERLALLEALAGDGFTLAELRSASDSGTLFFLPADRAIAGGELFTAAQVAERAGVDLAFLTALRHAMGMPAPDPSEPDYSADEIASVEAIHAARAAGLTDEDILELLRVLGRGLAQAAEVMRSLPLRAVIEPGVSEAELAERYGALVGELYPLVGPLVASLLALHLRHATHSEVVSAMERRGGQLPGARPVSVCFVDMVGFTRLGEELSPLDLARLAGRLDELATEFAAPPVRLVKTIGDAAMLVSPEPAPLLGAALDLVDGAESAGDGFPPLRAGAALGEGLQQGGDWFGQPVNLASRITATARPGSLLVDAAVHDAVPDGFRYSFAGERRIRGVRGAVGLYRVRRQEAG